jgi:hypothetical protein
MWNSLEVNAKMTSLGELEMSNFVLVDLYDQRTEVRAFTQGWKPEEILNWLKKYGTVKKVTSSDPHLYGFTSASGSQSAFRLTESEGLSIMHPR